MTTPPSDGDGIYRIAPDPGYNPTFTPSTDAEKEASRQNLRILALEYAVDDLRAATASLVKLFNERNQDHGKQ